MGDKKLFIFDYSGTLSLESTLFGRPDYLTRELEESGLSNMGITSPAIFWEEIVNPTWYEGSTTAAGYKKIIEDRLRTLTRTDAMNAEEAKAAASSFVDSYLRHSRIDRSWGRVFRELALRPYIRVVIATDHYAEATSYILQFLRELNIQAMPATLAIAHRDSREVIVANSADLGFHKDKREFWEILRRGLQMNDVRNIVVVDDFGCNEEKGDSYSRPEKVKRRQRETVRMLQDVFAAKVEVVSFILKEKSEKATSDLVSDTWRTIDRYLATADDRV
ncbi:MAG TPA: hypothetical protein VLZ07_11730 [Syntrophales bacterium]|nr:hypothetical protein [Syntrophales bacterium]